MTIPNILGCENMATFGMEDGGTTFRPVDGPNDRTNG